MSDKYKDVFKNYLPEVEEEEEKKDKQGEDYFVHCVKILEKGMEKGKAEALFFAAKIC